MPARFFCQTGSFAGSSYQIADEVLIGRDGSGVRLPAEVVSGSHARIFFDEDRGSYFLEDLGSRNGTKLDGVPVAERARRLVDVAAPGFRSQLLDLAPV